ncbi:MAG: PAS domain S-box protein [Salinivirgaceae bacterium]|nr:PAS domain S-box protein [Salinivirgaceae bacterium]
MSSTKLLKELRDINNVANLINCSDEESQHNLSKLNDLLNNLAKNIELVDEKNENYSRIKNSEEHFRKLFEHYADATLIIENNRFIDCNKAALKMLRFKTRQEVFNTYPSILSPEFQPNNALSITKSEEMMEIAFQNGSHRFEWVHKRADGELFDAEVLLTKIDFQNRFFFHCVLRDISFKKINEEKLKISNENYKILFDDAVDGVLIGNNKGLVINANKSIAKISGYTLDEILNHNISHLFAEGELEKYPLRYDLVFDGKTIRKVRMLKRKDGTFVPIEMKTKKIYNNLLQAYVRDISGRVLYEQEILEKNIELEKTKNKLKQKNINLKTLNSILKEQKVELNIAKEKAEESDRLKSAFLANMSHEIRTPMNGILGFAQLLREPNIEGEKQEKFLQIINQSGRQMLGIINDLVDISKVEAGQMTVFIEPVYVNKVINDLKDFFSLEAEINGVDLNINLLLDNEFTIKTDYLKLKQILTNLIKNSLKFTKKGGSINLSCKKDIDMLHVRITDTGIGIPEEFHEHVFKRFNQVRDSITSNYGGSGLGLSICKAFVEMLQGEIWFESKKNKGSTFFFTLPLKQA